METQQMPLANTSASEAKQNTATTQCGDQ